MKTFKVTPKNPRIDEDIYSVIERDYLRNTIAGYVNSVRKARELFTSPLQAGILADTLANLADIWFGDLITVKEKEA